MPTVKQNIAVLLEQRKAERIAYYASPEIVALRKETEKHLNKESSFFMDCTNNALYHMLRTWMELVDEAKDSDLLDDLDMKILEQTHDELDMLLHDILWVGIDNFVLPLKKRNEIRLTIKKHVYPYVMVA